MVLHSTRYVTVCKGFKSHLHIFRLTPSLCNNLRHLAIVLRIYSSVGLHDYKIFARNFLLVAYSYRTRRQHRRRIINI